MAATALGDGPHGFSFDAILMQFTRLSCCAWRGDLPGVYPPRLRMCAGTNWLKSVMLAIYLYHVGRECVICVVEVAAMESSFASRPAKCAKDLAKHAKKAFTIYLRRLPFVSNFSLATSSAESLRN